MTDKEYKRLASELEKRGYRKWMNDRNPSLMANCNWCYAKSVRDDEGETLYQITWLVYDRKPYTDRCPSLKESPWGVEVKVYVDHGTELHLWNREYTVDEVEKTAEDFYEFITDRKLNEDGRY